MIGTRDTCAWSRTSASVPLASGSVRSSSTTSKPPASSIRAASVTRDAVSITTRSSLSSESVIFSSATSPGLSSTSRIWMGVPLMIQWGVVEKCAVEKAGSLTAVRKKLRIGSPLSSLPRIIFETRFAASQNSAPNPGSNGNRSRAGARKLPRRPAARNRGGCCRAAFLRRAPSQGR